MQIATKTLAAIEAALIKDQGAKYRGLLKDLMPTASDAYSTKEEDFRNHLGASLIGRECARELWFSFHWCTLERFDGRMLRLFNTGHLAEPKMVALLKLIGCQVWQIDANGKQFRINGHRGHFGGSMDGVAVGIPDLPEGLAAITEFKTHGEKSFVKLVADGVRVAKPEHVTQMNIYMGKNSLTWAFYMAVNKNTDELHAELIPFDPTQYQRYLDRSAMIIDSATPPPRISNTPGFFKCKFCSHIKLCHLDMLPVKNCRTCISSRILDEGKWACVHPVAKLAGDSEILTPEEQRAECDFWEMNPVIKSAQ
jgi:hypothetical protein